MTKWLEVPGTITKVWLDSFHDDDHYDIFTPEVRYHYTIDGNQYEGRRIYRYTFSTSNAKAAQNKLKKYVVGSTVTVYVNENDPNDALLVKSFALDVAMGLVALLYTVFMVFLGVAGVILPLAFLAASWPRSINVFLLFVLGHLVIPIVEYLYIVGNWRQVQGKIQSCDIKFCDNENNYVPKVAYHYVVDGKNYENDQFYRVSRGVSRRKAEKKLKKYAVGSPITIFVNRNEPSWTFIVNNDNTLLFILFYFLYQFTTIVALMLVIAA